MSKAMSDYFLILRKTYPLWAGVNLYLSYIVLLTAHFIPWQAEDKQGLILFWQNDAIYTITPQGTNLTLISPALRTDQRILEVSPSCYRLIKEPCSILIGHVLYYLSGRSRSLPTGYHQAWLNAPVSWSPDGILSLLCKRRAEKRKRLTGV